MYNGSTRLLDQFIAHISVERGLARATVRAYESDLRRYLSWLAHTRGITDPDAIGKADIEEYVAQLDSDGDSARSKARRLASIHEFHRFALAQHAVSDDVSATVKAPKSAQMLPDVLTIDEVCERYNLTLEEFASWQRAVDRSGMQGLRVTRIQHYRDLYERQLKY